MKRLALLLAFALCLPAAAFGQAPSKAAQSASSDQFFPVEQVRPGMRAVGYTVFHLSLIHI